MNGLYEQVRIALHQLWRRRWAAMAVAWAVALLGWFVLALIPNNYEAKARIFVQQQSILPAQTALGPDDRAAQLLRLRQTLTSNDNLARIVRRTDLNSLVASERDLDNVVTALRDRITITAQPDGMIEIKASSNISGFSNAQNARAAAGVAQGLVDTFVEQNLAGDRAQTGQSLQFLDAELARRAAALQEAEQRQAEFDQRYASILPGDGPISQRMAAARAELDGLQQQIVAGQAALNSMRAQLAATPASLPGTSDGGGATTATGQIATLQGQINQNLARGWTEQHPDIIAAREQIARLRPYAAAEARGGAPAAGISNPSYTSLRALMGEREATVAAAIARRNQIQSDLAQLSARQSSEPGVAAEQERLARDHDVLKQQYDQLLANREQVRLRSDAQSQAAPINVQVVEPPSIPTVPAAPNRPLFLTAVLVLALGAGAAAAFVLGQIQTTFPTQSRLAAITGLPVLGTVSEVVTAPVRALRRRRLVWLGGAGAALAGCYAVLMLVEFWQRAQVA
jgi:polysaccharide chain length determinant protein (PEP-CTERM system associated)